MINEEAEDDPLKIAKVDLEPPCNQGPPRALDR